jgi:DNA invertase Pin-like site-specific DNA recombinase
MTDHNKVQPSHTQRIAFVYIRQSTLAQVEHNRESTARQYDLTERACELGWGKERVIVIDEDLGLSGQSAADRSGFTRLASEVALGRAGIVLGLEVSRLARNNADWYRLLDLCGITDTLIGDSDGVYHPALFNDRLILGLKGTMSEAELHVIRARLQGGRRNKAERGELRGPLPVGFVWGDEEGEVRFHPDESVTGAIRTTFERFAEIGSVRQVWLWFRSEGLSFPTHNAQGQIRWAVPTYIRIYHVLSNPFYAGAYAYGKHRLERYVDERGVIKKRLRRMPMTDWAVLLPRHHEGFIDWETYEANQVRIDANARPQRNEAGGAVREGTALLQGIARCGHCGRRLRTEYHGRNSTPTYICGALDEINGQGLRCLTVGGVSIDQAVARAFLDAVKPAAVEATLLTVQQLQTRYDAGLAQWRLEVERARYEAGRAQRRYEMCEPENRLVARGLECEWENRLRELSAAEAELHRHEQRYPRVLSPEQLQRIHTLGSDLRRVWNAASTTARDRKELLRTLLEEVIITVKRGETQGHLTLRWLGGAFSEIDVRLPHQNAAMKRTDEDTITLIRRLAVHYPDAVTAGILNHQNRKTASGERFTASHVSNLRNYHEIPCFRRTAEKSDGELVTVKKAAEILGVTTATILRWLDDGFIVGEQITAGAPWSIRITDELRVRLVEQTPSGYLTMREAMRRLGVSRQTVWHRVKRGELEAVHVRYGKHKALRIKVIDRHPGLFEQSS